VRSKSRFLRYVESDGIDAYGRARPDGSSVPR
jgi:hypothetical protein